MGNYPAHTPFREKNCTTPCFIWACPFRVRAKSRVSSVTRSVQTVLALSRLRRRILEETSEAVHPKLGQARELWQRLQASGRMRFECDSQTAFRKNELKTSVTQVAGSSL